MRKYRKPHRIKRKKPFFKKKYFWLGFFGFVFSVLVIYVLIFSQYFQIENITISGNEKTSKQSILEIIENRIKKSVLFIPTKSIFLANITEIKKQALNTFPQILELEINKSFPKSLNIVVIERFGMAVFCQDIQKDEQLTEKCFLLDQKGIVFEPALNNAEFLRIKKPNLKTELKLGERGLEEDLFSKILKTFSVLQSLEIQTERFLIVSDERINILTSQNWEIYFNPQKDLNWQLTKLEALLKEHIPLENRSELDYVELRFGDLAPFKYK
ncbi:MAG: cell division protein FtsQ/DivIB [Candidatus Nealsonbacteria bacterium]